ncbi:MAG: gluconate 2-dehydrogenase subunit 3 family protein [Bryobacteraceae bacterium]
MKRRRILQGALALPALQGAATAQTAGSSTFAVDALPKLEVTGAEAVAAGDRRFFSEAQYKALAALCDAIAPATDASPSAVSAEVPEFLDFLVHESPAGTQKLYRDGLDRVARDGATAATLAPLTQPWSYQEPADPFARFLRQAKNDILTATANSKAAAEMAREQRRRGGSGTGYYWRSLD